MIILNSVNSVLCHEVSVLLWESINLTLAMYSNAAE